MSDVKFSHSGRYMLTRDYLTVKVWDLNMEARPIETYQVGAATRKIWGTVCGWGTPSPPLCLCTEGLSQLSMAFISPFCR